jgi:hypothetical protein
MRPSAIRRALLAAVFTVAPIVAGCVSDGPRPDRASPGPQPRGAAPTRLAIATPNFIDSDGNGYADTVTPVVYLFTDGYDVPLDIAGSFLFRLHDRRGQVLAEWPISLEQADACRIVNAVGHGYAFSLDLRRVGAERIEQTEGVLVAEFTDTKGRRVASDKSSAAWVSVGRVR